MSSFLFAVLACTGGKQPILDEPVGDAPAAPVARIGDTVDTYHGVQVADPYRWLEDASSPEVTAYSDAQNVVARQVLQALPGRDALKADLALLMGEQRTTHYPVKFGGDRIFAMRKQPPKNQAFLVELPALDASAEARTLLDPEAMPGEGNATIDWFVPSPDGALVAVSVSRGGTESGDLHVLDVQTLERVEPVLPRVNGGTAGGALAWRPDSSGFFYTRYPRDGERDASDMAFYVQLFEHTLGADPAGDSMVLGDGLPRIAEIDLEAHHATSRLLITVQDGDGGEFAHWVRDPDGAMRQLSDFGDGTVMLTFSEAGDQLYAVSFTDAPKGSVFRLPVTASSVEGAEVVVPESEHAIVPSFWSPPSVRELSGTLFVEFQTGGPSEFRAFTLEGEATTAPEQPEVGSAGAMFAMPDGRLLVESGSFTTPWTWTAFDPRTGSTEAVPLNQASTIALPEVEVRREMAPSADGTLVPVNLIVPAGIELDGSHPVIVNGYGGYGVNITPRYRSYLPALLGNGVIMAVANLRGGGEFGEAWHEQGMLTHKQNVFDDFHAVLQHLVARGYTTPQRTGIVGGSNGGLLMGATFVQHPEAAAVVVSSVGIYDMLRVELSPNGAFNVTEFGTVTDPAHFEALRAYSPYHNVVDGTDVPPILFTTGANDPRVDPMQSRKMTARMQAAMAAGSGPVLLRTSNDTGHGSGTPLATKIEEEADELGFLLHHLGVSYERVLP
ncbi:MAG: prolyl oligopeptidase family serine peptidase [Myxococcales bacterium]|nr:prolyl oligopeptidase family serine peptidase [Myxococcales bacterium]